MVYGFFSNDIVYIKFDWLINTKQCIGYTYVIFGGYGFVSLRSIFLLIIRWHYKMALSSVISLDEMKSLVLTKRKTHREISNILKKRYPDM